MVTKHWGALLLSVMWREAVMWQKGWTEERNLLVRVIVLVYWSVNRKGEKETIRRVEKS